MIFEMIDILFQIQVNVVCCYLTGQAVEVLAGQVEVVLEGLVWQHLLAPELGGDQLGVDLVSVLPGDVSPHRVVPGEAAVAVGARHADALVPLPDVRPQVGLVPVRSLAKWAFQLRP